MATIIGFDRKGDLIDAALLCQPHIPLTVLLWEELQIAMLQPVRRQRVGMFINVIVQLLAQHLRLEASRRLMMDTLHALFKRRRPHGTWPRLSEWIELIENINTPALSRLGQYREASLFALKSIIYEVGDAIDYAASDLFDKICAYPGCVVIRTDGVSAEMASLLASLIINHAYESRAHTDTDTLEPLLFILDDALPLVRGSIAQESEGSSINPLSTWAFMGRARKLGFVVAAQNYALISPALRNNSATVMCFGSYGRDAEELARDLHLSREQASALPVLQPGETIAIARTVWPYAVYGKVPEVR